MNHFGESEVVHVPGLAGNFAPSFFADDGMAKEFFFHPGGLT
jgi:hypothetical protein